MIRSILCIPGHRLDWIQKARANNLYGADAVLLDLEDSVPQGKKAEAAMNILGLFGGKKVPLVDRQLNSQLHVRIDPRTALASAEDPGFLSLLETAIEMSGYETSDFWVWVPKLERPVWEVAAEAQRLGFSVCLCIESPQAVLDLPMIRRGHVTHGSALAFGLHDFRAELGRASSWSLIEHAACEVALHAAAAGLPAWMAPSYEVRDVAVEADASFAAGCGFTGMGAIRPRDIAAVAAGFAPAAEELASAARVLAARGATEAVFRLPSGDLVSPPTVRWARKVLGGA